MNEKSLEIARKRNRKLLIVEGKHEKDILFKLIFRVFPEIDISIEDILIYGTNIYMLYKDIIKEYGDKWFEDDVDLPFIVGKKKGYSSTLGLNDFSNVYLIFDYERHDPNFCENKIKIMQDYFCDSTDMGKLYLNYPMLESYQHFSDFPDTNYENLAVRVTPQPGSQYKKTVHNSFVARLVLIPLKIERVILDSYCIKDNDACKKLTEKVLEISNKEKLSDKIDQIFKDYLSPADLNRAKNHFNNILVSMEHIKSGTSYYKYMRNIFKQIILHNIKKGSNIQKVYIHNNYKKAYELLDLSKILEEQNIVSKDKSLGYIWVLNTCVYIIPDYNFKLIQ